LAPHDGSYVVQLRESTFGGNDNCHYRLHIGSFPRPTSVYPLGAMAGDEVSFIFYSAATGGFTNKNKPPGSIKEKFGVFSELNGLPAPSPNWIHISAFSNLLEVAPNQDRKHATATELEPPLALNGIISRKGEDDWFSFRAVKGIALEVN